MGRDTVKGKENAARAVFFLSAGVSVLAVLVICIFLFANGIPAMLKIGVLNFLGGTHWKPMLDIFGILPMITGSLCVTLGALIIGVPAGVLTAVFLVYFCPKKIYKFAKPAIDLLAGIPSVVYGFFGLMVIVPAIREISGNSGTSMLAASVVLGIMILPTIIGLSEASIRAVNAACYEGSLALGASHERSVFYAVLPAARSGINASIILGVGRAVGETMAVIMVAGNQALLPRGIFKGIRTLTANIALEMGYAADLHRDALIATAVTLFVIILLVNFLFSFFKRKQEQ
ncbi:MAG: phosphate ABC transporter permease subunit PstC [Treponema sp.]|jgi:phosphate transport system permease protein|nr:phosphate ABC transporter permease subunit PstC [Treponema sp.]